jgi:ABC-type uncharacterized transport system substrate-binding protein
MPNRTPILQRFLLGLSLAMAVALAATPAAAHPHVFVTASATINIEDGAIRSISHVWTFDEFYSAMAMDGIAKNKDGGYGRAELAELAQVNIDGLKEFDYFTYASLGKGPVMKVLEPKKDDYWLEYTDAKVLALHFTVPLDKPVPITSKGFNLVITDPSYFIAFDLDEKDPVKLNAAAPKSCKAFIDGPAPEPESADEKRLTGAFAEQMAQVPLNMGGVVKSIRVDCAP